MAMLDMDIGQMITNGMISPVNMEQVIPDGSNVPPMPLPPSGYPPMPTSIANIDSGMLPPEIPAMAQAQGVNPMIAPAASPNEQGLERFAPVFNVLGNFAAQIEDAQARANLPADLYLKMKNQQIEQQNAKQEQLLRSMQLEADIKYKEQSLEIQREQNAISREALLRGGDPTALMQNYAFVRALMPNANPIDILPLATASGASAGYEYDEVTGAVTKKSKPLPASVLNQQTQLIEDLSISKGTQENLDKFIGQIDQGKLNFGLVSNAINKIRNNINLSTEESRNLSSFQSSLEKLRNDSLRLNAGVQTDGDAQRAWNELIQNLNDEKVVKQRLQEIKEINRRGEGLKKLQIDTLRENFGAEPYDYQKVENIGNTDVPVMDRVQGKTKLKYNPATGDFE